MVNDRERYAPGPAGGEQVRQDGERWTLAIVRAMHRNVFALCVAVGFIGASAQASSAHPTFTVIRTFVGGSMSMNPEAGLIADNTGNLYGTATAGGNAGCVVYGSTGCGTVFELSPPAQQGGSWTEIVLHRFQGGDGPWFPVAGLTMDKAGDLFGTTTDGGPYDCPTTYCGTVFELAHPAKSGGQWHARILYRFTSGAGGENPFAGVILGPDGDLYGTTFNGGPRSDGVVYRLSPPARGDGWWTETVLTGFEVGGIQPIGGVVFDRAGDLFGTTYQGGSNQLGLIFELKPTRSGFWKESVLYDFGSNACYPKTNLVIDGHGDLFGTAQGCPELPGAVFELSPPRHGGQEWSESVLAQIRGNTNFDPTTGVALDGAGDVFGSAASMGSHDRGSVFELAAPNWDLAVLHDFDGRDGDFATAGPAFGPSGALFGTTLDGGSRIGPCKVSGCGVAYEVSP
jgi:uncharacterized repeat protein (TIGR03803 family)